MDLKKCRVSRSFEWHPEHHISPQLLHLKTETKVYFVSLILNFMKDLNPVKIYTFDIEPKNHIVMAVCGS